MYFERVLYVEHPRNSISRSVNFINLNNDKKSAKGRLS